MSWGYKLMATFIVFAVMMIYMVYRCFGTNFELVENEYYKSELKYQQVIDGTNQANSLSTAPVLNQLGNMLVLKMPDEMKNGNVSGSILFYCAYNSKKDKKILLMPDTNGTQAFNHIITPGIYTVKIDWNKAGKNYYAEKKITVH
ncbi:MAG: FixH family protein [Bacteroidota bacterium]